MYARLWMSYGGPYEAIARSVRALPALDAGDTLAPASCADLTYGSTTFVTRWTPPGPGTYDVEFRIEPLGAVPDLPTNNVVTKRLTVTSSASVNGHAARGEDRP